MENKNILIVDDEPRNLQLLREVLKSDYKLFFAKRGLEALERVKQLDLDLILLDVMMPEMDGFEVCRRLKGSEDSNRIPILFVTALSMNNEVQKCLDAGAIGHLTKPIDPNEVREAIKELIG